MDEFALIVLEDTLELAAKQLPAEEIADCVNWIRNYTQVVVLDPNDKDSAGKLGHVLTALSKIAGQNQKFLLVSRLQSIAREFNVSDVA